MTSGTTSSGTTEIEELRSLVREAHMALKDLRHAMKQEHQSMIEATDRYIKDQTKAFELWSKEITGEYFDELFTSKLLDAIAETLSVHYKISISEIISGNNERG